MTHPAQHRCQDCGDKATTYRMRHGFLNWLCEDCAKTADVIDAKDEDGKLRQSQEEQP